MKTVLQGWNFMRIPRPGFGIAFFVQGIVVKETMTMVLGVVFGGLALANISCWATNGYAINNRSTNKRQKINYEELDSKK